MHHTFATVAVIATLGLSVSTRECSAQDSTNASPAIRLGAAPTVVGPGVISTPVHQFKATVSPDGQTLMYVLADRMFRHMTLIESHRQAGAWGAPVVAEFSGIWRDGDPAFTPDGRAVLFISNRPHPGDSAGALRRTFAMWRVERRANGTWGTPAPFGPTLPADQAVFAPSVTTSGVLYFGRGDSIYRAEPSGGQYAAPRALPFDGGDPSISADERFVVFDHDWGSPANSDLFVSCRTGDGWTKPKRFAEPVNSTFEEGDPWVSTDGHWLYFFSDRSTRDATHPPRPSRATYADVEREAMSDIFNGSRNLYAVDLSSWHCGA